MKDNRILLYTIVITAGVALFSMLIYNFVHTGNLLASYIEPWWVGYIAAFGIELSVVGLSATIGTRKWHNLNAAGFYIVLVAVVIVSFLANVSQGHLIRYGTDITIESFSTLDLLQGIIGMAATGLISIITMAMAEIIGQYIVSIAQEREIEVGDVPQTKGQLCKALSTLMPEAGPTKTAKAASALLGEDVSVGTASRSQ